MQVEKINALESKLQQLSDEDLRDKTKEFRERLKKGTKLDDLLVEAFAVSFSPWMGCNASIHTSAQPSATNHIQSHSREGQDNSQHAQSLLLCTGTFTCSLGENKKTS